MDHMKYCGNTIEAIAEQKAGIIKEGVPVVTTADGPALQVIARKAYEKHSRLYALDHSFDVVGSAGPEDPEAGQMGDGPGKIRLCQLRRSCPCWANTSGRIAPLPS